MGYTHYFNFTSSNFKDKFIEKELEIVKDICKRYEKIIRYEQETQEPPLITEKLIRFNGIHEDAHETFYLDFSEGFVFCKTARKPYDLPVCEVLLVIKYFNSNKFELSSDGFWVGKDSAEKFEEKNILELDGNWNTAIENVKNLYGIELNFKLVKEISGGIKYYQFVLFD